MIYPTQTGTSNHEWFLNSSASNLLGESANRGAIAREPITRLRSQVRAHAETKFGYNTGDLETDHDKIDLNQDGTGHMMKGGGWRDVEMTGYFYATQSASDDDAEFVPYVRGGRHNGDACEGFAYKTAFNYNTGQIRVRKEQWHPSGYVSGDWRTGYGGSVRNKWVGAKFICVNRGARAQYLSLYGGLD